MSSSESLRLPSGPRTYRIVSTDPNDARTLAAYAPAPLSARGACGVAVDLARHLRGEARIVTLDGEDGGAPIRREFIALRAIRAGMNPPEAAA